MGWRHVKEESTHNLIFIFPGKQGSIQLTHAEWVVIKNLAEKKDLSFEDATILLIRMAITSIIDKVIEKEITKDEDASA